MGQEAIIHLEALSYSIEGKEILKDINLVINKGELVGLIGPNGAGKTTLLKSINGLKKVEGQVFLGEKNTKKMKKKALARLIALMKQDTEVKFPFSVWQVVLMGRYPHLDWTKQEKEKDQQIAKKYMEYTNTWSLAHKSIQELSGGERQRTMMAKVLTQETPVILLDEPTANLDIAYQEQIFRYSQQFCQEGGTVIAAVHDLKVAAKYCHRLVLLKEGQIIAQGKPEEVLTPANLRVAYGVNALSYRNSITGEWDVYLPHCFQQQKIKLHLIGGGGGATPLLRSLYQQGYDLTLGVIHRGDTDEESARIFNIPTVLNPPFSSITMENYALNLDLIEQTHVTILCSIPFGKDNLDNLRAATHADNLVILEDQAIEERDFTGGQATQLYEQIKHVAKVLTSDNLQEFLKRSVTLDD